MNNLKLVNILEPGGGGGQCLSYRSLKERREGMEAFKTSLKRRTRRRLRRRRRKMMMMCRRWRGRGGNVEWRRAWLWRRACWSSYPRSPLPLVSFTCSSCFKVLFPKKMLNNHIVEIHKDPTSWSNWGLQRHQITCHLPPFPVCQNSATNVTVMFET